MAPWKLKGAKAPRFLKKLGRGKSRTAEEIRAVSDAFQLRLKKLEDANTALNKYLEAVKCSTEMFAKCTSALTDLSPHNEALASASVKATCSWQVHPNPRGSSQSLTTGQVYANTVCEGVTGRISALKQQGDTLKKSVKEEAELYRKVQSSQKKISSLKTGDPKVQTLEVELEGRHQAHNKLVEALLPDLEVFNAEADDVVAQAISVWMNSHSMYVQRINDDLTSLLPLTSGMTVSQSSSSLNDDLASPRRLHNRTPSTEIPAAPREATRSRPASLPAVLAMTTLMGQTASRLPTSAELLSLRPANSGVAAAALSGKFISPSPVQLVDTKCHIPEPKTNHPSEPSKQPSESSKPPLSPTSPSTTTDPLSRHQPAIKVLPPEFAKIVSDYVARDNEEHSLTTGEHVMVTVRIDGSDWWEGSITKAGPMGLLKASCLQLIGRQPPHDWV